MRYINRAVREMVSRNNFRHAIFCSDGGFFSLLSLFSHCPLAFEYRFLF